GIGRAPTIVNELFVFSFRLPKYRGHAEKKHQRQCKISCEEQGAPERIDCARIHSTASHLLGVGLVAQVSPSARAQASRTPSASSIRRERRNRCAVSLAHIATRSR